MLFWCLQAFGTGTVTNPALFAFFSTDRLLLLLHVYRYLVRLYTAYRTCKKEIPIECFLGIIVYMFRMEEAHTRSPMLNARVQRGSNDTLPRHIVIA